MAHYAIFGFQGFKLFTKVTYINESEREKAVSPVPIVEPMISHDNRSIPGSPTQEEREMPDAPAARYFVSFSTNLPDSLPFRQST